MRYPNLVRLLFLLFLTILPSVAQTIGYREARASTGSGTLEAPIPFSALGVRWSATEVPAISVRSSSDGAAWSDWKQLSADIDSGLSTTRLVWVGDRVKFLEWRSTDAALTFVFIDPGQSKATSSMKEKSISRAIDVSKPDVVSRTGWGCPDGQNFRGTPTYTTVTHLIVHHTADGPVADYSAWVRAIWTYHIFSNGWADIGYNYLVAPDGRIFEGRAGGENVMGAHFSGQNSNTMGVSVLGTFITKAPTSEALNSLNKILTWKADREKLDPLSVSLHPGTRLNLFTISGHRDANPSKFATGTTECPGDTLYAMLPAIRQQTAAAVNATHTKLIFSEDAEQDSTGWTATGLWHVTSKRKAAGQRSWWYGDEETGSYDTAGSANSGTLTSPAFEVTADATLSFKTWYETENPTADWDRKFVEVSVNGGEWQLVDQLIGIERQWITRNYPLPGLGTMRVRFRFDTVDANLNTAAGWFIDDFVITIRQ